MKKIFLLSLFLSCMIFLLFGCGLFAEKEKKWQPVKQAAKPLLHTVKWHRESLPMIAKWYTGDQDNSDAIAYANPTINPERLTVGNRIFIPVNLIKERKPLPRNYIATFNKKAVKPKKVKKPAKKPEEPKKKEDEFEFFGPK